MIPGFRPTAVYVHDACVEQHDSLAERAANGDKRCQAAMTRLQTAVTRIRRDGQWGEVIPRTRIPRYFETTYGATNLYCIDLARDIRAFYTVDKHDVILLDIMDHDAYDKLFNQP